jgi:hypothetical protein
MAGKVKLEPIDGEVPEDNRADDDDALGDRPVLVRHAILGRIGQQDDE